MKHLRIILNAKLTQDSDCTFVKAEARMEAGNQQETVVIISKITKSLLDKRSDQMKKNLNFDLSFAAQTSWDEELINKQHRESHGLIRYTHVSKMKLVQEYMKNYLDMTNSFS